MRRRCLLSEEDRDVMLSITAAVNNVADAIHETKIEDMHPQLYEVVMGMTGFSEEALIVTFSHFLDNKAQGSAFVKMTDPHRVLWLRTFLGKHYYL